MENIMNKPVIGVVMCRNRLKGHETQTLQEKYLNAIINAGLTCCLTACAGRARAYYRSAANHGRNLPAGQPSNDAAAFMVKTAMSLTPIPGEIF